jgi:hypothetical protein
VLPTNLHAMSFRKLLLAALPFALLGLVITPPSLAQAPAGPTGLRAFLLRYDEPLRHDFSRTPSFAWNPVAGASSYDFQLATSSDFRDNSIVWSSDSLSAPLTAPTVSVPLSLPWITGNPYSMYARVRANTQSGTTRWSDDFGFNMRWNQVPAPMTAPNGLLRWTPIDGATAYEVWEVGITSPNVAISWNKWYFVASNVTDMRDWYTFHDSSWYTTARWRVRAVRIVYGSALDDFDGISYGPWSPVYTTTNTALTKGPITLGGTSSDVSGTVAAPKAHSLMPGFYWSGDRSLTNNVVELYRVYAFSDRDCVHPVYTGAIVGSPAWVPRFSGPLALPTNQAGLDAARDTVMSDGGQENNSYGYQKIGPIRATESGKKVSDPNDPFASSAGSSGSASTPSSSSGSGSTSGGSTPTLAVPSSLTDPFAKPLTLDLWDRAWPSGAYFWTVIPVLEVVPPNSQTTLALPVAGGATSITVSGGTLTPGSQVTVGSEGPFVVTNVADTVVTLDHALVKGYPAGTIVFISGGLEYWDGELAQDTCSVGRVSSFGKISQPVTAGGKTPYVTGLAAGGQLQTASSAGAPVVYGTPLVAWGPALGAEEYEVQWSKSDYPFQPAGQAFTYSTSALLQPLEAGTWYYRVRGIDFQMPKDARAMAWSKTQQLVVGIPTFAVVDQSSAAKQKSPAKKSSKKSTKKSSKKKH